MLKKLVRTLLLPALLAQLLSVGARAAYIEQTQVKMPGIDVYLYQDESELSGLPVAEVTAVLDGVPLTVRGLGRSEQGIFYVYMLDVSASIPASHFNAARDAVATAYERLRPQDKMALLTFGNEVTLRLGGGEGRDEVMTALQSLQNRDNSTKFYNAMDALVDLVSQTSEMRRVAVVISDGIDDTDAGMTQEELETELRQSGVSVSAMCLDSAPEAVVGKLRDFIHISGGELYQFGALDASDVLGRLLGRLEGGWLLRLEASNNLAKGNVAELSIALGSGETVTSDVKLDDWVPDDTRPRVTGAVYDETSNTLLVSFSEPVTGAELLTAYALTDRDGTALPIDSAELLEDGSCRLHMAGAMPGAGGVTLTVSGPRDVSMEENELYRYSDIVVAGAGAPESAPSAAPAENGPDEPLLDLKTLIFFGVALLLIVAGAVALLVRSFRKAAGGKRKLEPEAGDKKKAKEKEEKPTATFMFDRKP